VIPAHPAPRKDLSDQPIAAHRTVVMSESFDSATNTPYFYMNGVLFQNITPADVVQMTLGTTEEWVIRNDPSIAAGGTAEDHPFHIHVNDMVQTGRGTWDPITGAVLTYEAVNPKGTADTLNVPAGEYVVMRMQLLDFTGRSVFHCHIAFHEDMGMMGEILIVDPPPDPSSTTTTSTPTSTTTPSTVTPAQAVVVTPTFSG
jgi:FtsP/CotA-like multicopper oxidase with cupredoxin domain